MTVTTSRLRLGAKARPTAAPAVNGYTKLCKRDALSCRGQSYIDNPIRRRKGGLTILVDREQARNIPPSYCLLVL